MYSTAAGMAAQQHRLDALSNDIANVNTTGYKRVRVAFRDLLYTPETLATQNITEGAGAAATMIGRGYAQGSAQRTDAPTDVLIQGQGFLRMRRPDGTEMLTRDGNLRFDGQGRLGSQRGDLLQPEIKLPAGATEADVKIAEDGRVTVGTTEIGRIQLVNVASPDKLQALGDNAFAATAESGPVRAGDTGAKLTQGALEMSNVDMGDAIAEMTEAQRAYEMASKAIQAQDRAAEIANGIKR